MSVRTPPPASMRQSLAKHVDASVTWMVADPVDAGGAADAISTIFANGESAYAAVILPHAGAGPAIAARVAATIGATLVTGCSDLRIDETGDVRASRPRY